MKLIVFGASGKTGKLLVEQALSDNHMVTAFVRNPSNLNISNPNLTIIQGDATNASAVKKAILGHDAVISTLGTETGLRKSTLLHEMTQNIVQGMKEQQVSRIAYMASAGIDKEIPGMIGKITMKLLGNVLDDHHNAVAVLKDNDLQWTIARPLGLNDKPLTGSYRKEATGVPKGGRTISRADVADFLYQAIVNEEFIHQSVALSD
ncbi:NAD(P)-dependent oxidoreductase [Sporosarcina gallistercoris]|uniref:SDR family oxidoreductase n=1 Tax=Sporosarcina gallistercoris TaxID=2762245 RepID=A0ABR8PKU2_9BACL|nr:NAD(P)-binding oxidoreductase [Sporosarcina gallistercoris]MBD7908801.1 SDR family oxidoreductase [Sporosarcina gallistercoris]